MRLVNTFEGGTDETTVSVANSGGASGDAFDVVGSGSGTVRVYDTAHAMYGTMSMRVATGVTSVQARAAWSTSMGGGTFTRLYGRLYFRTGSDTTNGRNLVGVRGASANIGRVSLTVANPPLLTIINVSGTAVVTSTSAVAFDTWQRLEWSLGSGPSTSCTARLYIGDSTKLVEEISGTGNFGSTAIDEVSFGQTTAGTNVPNGWWDHVEVNDYGYPGPVRRSKTLLGMG